MSTTGTRTLPTLVKLRALTQVDFEAVHVLLSDWKVVQYMLLPHCTNVEVARKCFEDLMAHSPGGAWQNVARAIEVVDSGVVMSLCGIAMLPYSREGEIWYLLRPDYWGRGIAQRAARELLKIGFSEMNLHRMYATCLPENPASARVLEKNGMRNEGYQLKNVKIHGSWHDSFLYAILREEWERMVGGAPGDS